MKTEIKIETPKTIRFDGWHCMYDCDMLVEDGDIVCQLFDGSLPQKQFTFYRLQACIKKYGDGETQPNPKIDV